MFFQQNIEKSHKLKSENVNNSNNISTPMNAKNNFFEKLFTKK